MGRDVSSSRWGRSLGKSKAWNGTGQLQKRKRQAGRRCHRRHWEGILSSMGAEKEQKMMLEHPTCVYASTGNHKSNVQNGFVWQLIGGQGRKVTNRWRQSTRTKELRGTMRMGCMQEWFESKIKVSGVAWTSQLPFIAFNLSIRRKAVGNFRM